MTAQLRNRPPVTLTLSPEALGWLDELAAAAGQSRSAAVEAMRTTDGYALRVCLEDK